MLSLRPSLLLQALLLGVASAAPAVAVTSGLVFLPGLNETVDARVANLPLNAVSFLQAKSHFDATKLTEAQKQAYQAAIHLSSAAYYDPTLLTPKWICPRDCNTGPVPNFRVEKTGGGSVAIPPAVGSLQYFVGFNPNATQDISLAGVNGGNGTVVVSFRGTNSGSTILANEESLLVPLDTTNPQTFKGAPSNVMVHTGFQQSFLLTVEEIVAAVSQSLKSNNANTVLVTGHSQGAAVALLQAVALKNRLASNIVVTALGLAMPRTGNVQWADYVDSVKLGKLTHIGNGLDPIPVTPPTDGRVVSGLGSIIGPLLGDILPGFVGTQQLFSQVSGEIHIESTSVALGPRDWYSCPGRDNIDAAKHCISAVVADMTVLQAVTNNGFRFHTGPYIDTCMGQPCPGV